jgi:hypothetical protein
MRLKSNERGGARSGIILGLALLGAMAVYALAVVELVAP